MTGERLARALTTARRLTRDLLAPLGDDDVHRQFNEIMGPLVWDVGHVANFEEQWLLRQVAGKALAPEMDALYDPVAHPRRERERLPLLDRHAAFGYADAVRAEALEVLRTVDLVGGPELVRDGYVYSMIVQHEVQHQETMVQALDLRPDLAPYAPAAALPSWRRRDVDDEARVVVEGGVFLMGTDDRAEAYDNERPAHPVEVGTFVIDRFPVTARRYAAFVAASGYARPELWSEPGWAWRLETGHEAPQGWVPDGEGGWLLRRLGWLRPLDPAEPVVHVSYWEAEAFARFAGGRLPTEAEWEKAARWDPAAGRSRTYPWGDDPPSPSRCNVGRAAWGPAPVGSFPQGASASGAEQMVGDVYEWTSSDFEAYPGYSTFPYPEYSEIFFGPDHKVLRGASWVTSPLVARASYRNWDYPQRRQIHSGARVAYDMRENR